jgi:hypothetical protein
MMTANEDLIAWSQSWRIIGGIIFCRNCYAEQPETLKLDDFVHAPGCGHAGQHARPWQELNLICERFR